MIEVTTAEVVGGATGSALTLLVGLLGLWYKKRQADSAKHHSEAVAFELRARATSIASEQLLREMERISTRNDQLAGLVETQAAKIAHLESLFQQCEAREVSHQENLEKLRARVHELESIIAAKQDDGK